MVLNAKASAQGLIPPRRWVGRITRLSESMSCEDLALPSHYVQMRVTTSRFPLSA
jgi:hypothetical protein